MLNILNHCVIILKYISGSRYKSEEIENLINAILEEIYKNERIGICGLRNHWQWIALSQT